MQEKILEKLQKLTGHLNVVLTPRGNASIKKALEVCGKKRVLIPKEGGWLTYKQYPSKLGKELIEIKTDDALLNIDDLKAHVDEDSVLLYANPGGYLVEEPLKEIYDICHAKECLVILDASAGIGTDMCDGRYADIIVGSFGKWKPINAEYGGFISSKEEYDFGSFELDESKLSHILKKIEELPERIRFFEEKRRKIMNDLNDYDIVHPKSRGYVVVVKGSDEQLNEIKKYCSKNNLEWTDCPRYIRINDKAVSIEVKRL